MAKFNEKNVYTGRARIRARDIREALKDRNIDPALIHTLEGLADNDKVLRDQIDALAGLVDNCIDVVANLTAVLDQLKSKIPDLDKLAEAKNVLDGVAKKMMTGIARDNINLKNPDQT